MFFLSGNCVDECCISFLINLFIYLFFGCIGSSLLLADFL